MTDSRFHAFNFPVREASTTEEPEPFEIEINGDRVACVPEMDGLKLLRLTAVMRSRSFGAGERAQAMVEFLEHAVAEGEWSKFEKIVEKNNLDIEDLGDVIGYLSNAYSDRPTRSPEPSSAGATTTGSTSAAGSSSPDEIPV